MEWKPNIISNNIAYKAIKFHLSNPTYVRPIYSDNVIYRLKDPRIYKNKAIRYIGKTNGGTKERFSAHLSQTILEGTKNGNWIKSLLKQGFEPEIEAIQYLKTEKELDVVEIFWISYHKAIGCKLTNETNGGGGHYGYIASAETKSKISKSQHARFSSFEARLKLSKAKGGRPLVDQFGGWYPYLSFAAKQLNLRAPDICEVLQRRRNHVRGYIFRFEDDIDDLIQKAKELKHRMDEEGLGNRIVSMYADKGMTLNKIATIEGKSYTAIRNRLVKMGIKFIKKPKQPYIPALFRKKTNKTGFIGVNSVPPQKFQSQIKINGKAHYLGRFFTPEEAARAYDREIFKLLGNKARLNFPEEYLNKNL